MARIQTYNLDQELQLLDKVLGTDAQDNSTRNYTLQDIAAFFASRGIAELSKLGLGYVFQRARVVEGGVTQGAMFIPGDIDPPFNLDGTLTSIAVDERNVNGTNVRILLDAFVGSTIKIQGGAGTTEANYALYTLDGISTYQENGADVPGFVTLNLTFTTGNANANSVFTPGQVYSIASLGVGGGSSGDLAFNTIQVAGQDNVEANASGDVTFAGVGLTLTTNANNDVVTWSTDHPHTHTFNGRISDITRTVSAQAQTISGITITHSSGFSFVINSVKVPTGWPAATINTAVDPDTFDITIPANTAAGRHGVEVNYTSTELDITPSTSHTDVIDFDVILVNAVPTFRAGVLSGQSAAPTASTDISSITATHNFVNGSSVNFNPVTPLSDTSRSYAIIAIPTSLIDAQDFTANTDRWEFVNRSGLQFQFRRDTSDSFISEADLVLFFRITSNERLTLTDIT